MSHLYNISRTYEWNLKNPPKIKDPVRFAGAPAKRGLFSTYSPVGIAAGPLLNADFIQAAFDMGANIATYKTVRTAETPCLPSPNCVYILDGEEIKPGGTARSGDRNDSDTITNSFGMPSAAPGAWMPDVERAQKIADALPGRELIVSVVGTPPKEPSANPRKKLADDYAKCAAMAADAGARKIELNFSCPNVRADLGSVYQDAEFSGDIIRQVRKNIGGGIPLFVKVGYYEDAPAMSRSVDAALKSGATGIVGINTIPMRVVTVAGAPALPGRETSGVCGAGISRYAKKWLCGMFDLREKMRADFLIGGCGGNIDWIDLAESLHGADFALCATGAMLNPDIFREYFRHRGKQK
jgi:dihydroorotate dehydrogenase